MSNKSQLMNSLNKIDEEIFRCYLHQRRIVYNMIELHCDWSKHPYDKIDQIAYLKGQKENLERKIQELKNKKIILSCG